MAGRTATVVDGAGMRRTNQITARDAVRGTAATETNRRRPHLPASLFRSAGFATLIPAVGLGGDMDESGVRFPHPPRPAVVA